LRPALLRTCASAAGREPPRPGSSSTSATITNRRPSGRRSRECVIDPTIVSKLVARKRERGPLDELTEREREVLALIAEGHSNVGIGAQLFLSPKTVESHISQIFSKLDIRASADQHRRVLAVLTYLRDA
jgi:DNA-binding NarL/FixJ family response regulator